jgi:hypothetical protein
VVRAVNERVLGLRVCGPFLDVVWAVKQAVSSRSLYRLNMDDMRTILSVLVPS